MRRKRLDENCKLKLVNISLINYIVLILMLQSVHSMKIIFTISLFFIASLAFSQGQITIQRPNGGPTFFAFRLDSALAKAQNGDDIYLPGGGISGIPSSITKSVNIYGCGFNPDSSTTTGVSRISNSFLVNAPNVYISGIYITSSISVGNLANGFRATNLYSIGSISISSLSNNVYIKNCVFDGIDLNNNSSNIIVEKCIFNKGIGLPLPPPTYSGIPYSISGVFSNCIFNLTNWNPSGGSYAPQNLQFRNSIFNFSTLNGLSANTSFKNCIFSGTSTILGSNPLNSGNFFSVNLTDLFQLYSPAQPFSFTQNYALKSSAIGKNAGTDGTDIGIFGSDSPFKLSGRAINPQFMQIQIPSQTNAAGQLPIQIRVKAQDN
jgi:hypothetical protein